MAREPRDITIQPTGLVHAVFERLRRGPPLGVPCTRGFWGLAHKAMSNELVDHARARKSQKRGGANHRVPISQVGTQLIDDPHISTLLENSDVIKSALLELESIAPNGQRMVSIINSYYYHGLNWKETADALGISRKQVQRDWGFARTWLFDYVKNQGDVDGQ